MGSGKKWPSVCAGVVGDRNCNTSPHQFVALTPAAPAPMPFSRRSKSAPPFHFTSKCAAYKLLLTCRDCLSRESHSEDSETREGSLMCSWSTGGRPLRSLALHLSLVTIHGERKYREWECVRSAHTWIFMIEFSTGKLR